jgi:AcrR family transcriptional regulator
VTDDEWSLDPSMADLVKSQVEDTQLVNQRRGQFVNTAITLFCQKGYYVTTIKEIANAAGVSSGLIYQYVTDKEDILFLALQLIVNRLRRGLPAAIASASHPVEKFRAAFTEYCRVIDANRHACMLTYRETKSLSHEHREAIKGMELETNELIATTVRQAIAEGYFRELDVQLFVYHVIIVAHGWAIKHWRLSQLTTLEGYIQQNLDMMLLPLVTPKGRRAYDHAEKPRARHAPKLQ